MRILYLSLSYVPSRRASSMHVMRMCAALARAGHEVELVAKASTEPSSSGFDDYAFYGVAPSFKLTKLHRPAWRGGGVVFTAELLRTLLRERSRAELVFGRDPLGPLLAAELGMPVAFEWHEIPRSRLQLALLRRLARQRTLLGMVSISDALRRDVRAADLAAPDRPHVVAHDAADAPHGVEVTRPSTARPVVGYVGSLYAGRGIELILELARRMPDLDFELVGGNERDLATWRVGLPSNVRLAGFVPPAHLPARYAAMNVLVLPHSARGVAGASGGDISRWTSPLKMFEYMASGAPIIASSLPVLGEVLHHERNALIAPAGDLDAWERAVRRLVGNPTLAASLARCAYDDLVRHYTWDARVRTIFTGLGLEDAPAERSWSRRSSSL
ncbi:MAG: glycosyltransferase family 4 protein [Deltaproteobacteria bacterium]|nr:glycosyltransferase family 4 protein [Deltaproteobacteria bacterium]